MSDHRRFEPRVSSQDTPSSEAYRRAREPRIVQVDNLKALLVAWIIACHALLGYTAIGGWPYDEVTEVTLSPRAELVLSAVGADGTFCHQHLLFIAGLFAAPKMTHVGPRRFVHSRVV